MIDWDRALARRPRRPLRSPVVVGRREFLPCPGCGRSLAVYDGRPRECQRCRDERGTADAARELRQRREGEGFARDRADPVPYNEFPPGY